MLGGTFTTTIQAPPATVWALVSDLDTHAGWSPKPYTVEWLSGPPNQVGSTFRSVGWIPGKKDNVNRGEITERVESKRFAFQADDDAGRFINGFDLKPTGDGGTEVSFALTFPKLKGMAALMAPIAFPLAGRPDIQKRMALLKERAESAAKT